MTEPIAAENAAQIDAEAPTDLPEGNDPRIAELSAEAGKYRVRAKEAEAALQAAQNRLTAMQRLDIERVAGEVLAMPGDVWLNGNDVSSYLTEDCLVDVERVREDARLLTAERPRLKKLDPAVDYSQGSGNVTPGGKGTPTFSDLLK